MTTNRTLCIGSERQRNSCRNLHSEMNKTSAHRCYHKPQKKLPSESCIQESRIHIPFKSSKDHRRGNNTTDVASNIAPPERISKVIKQCIVDIAIKDRQSDEAREPEEHCQSVENENGEAMGERREEFGGETEVEDNKERPDGHEDEKGILGGGVVIAGD